MSKKNNFKKHDNCQCEIRWKVIYGNPQPAAGLFCSEHDAWIKWLPREEAFYLIKECNVPVTKYKERK